MKRIKQTIVCPKEGNCMQAVLASLFEVALEDAIDPPSFGHKWYSEMNKWLGKQGYSNEGTHNYCEDSIDETLACLKYSPSVDGYWYGIVASKTFEGVTHAVIINEFGMVMHDPNPNGLWEGINVVRTKELISWYMIKKVRS